MFTIYAEQSIFENLIVYSDLYPNLSKIVSSHANVCLNMSDDELLAELIPGTPIFEYILALGGKEPIALKPYFEMIYEDNSIIADKPRAAFFLEVTPDIAQSMELSYGVIVQSGDAITDTVLKGTFFKELPKDIIFEDHTSIGWKNVLKFPLPPSNAMVITDYYLFANEDRGTVIGQPNVVKLIDSFLPFGLIIPYHITIISNDDGKSKDWCERLTGQLKAEITQLRKYDILLEVVFTKTIHKRKIMLNYLNGSCDRGFAVFKVTDHKTVINDNDIRCDRLFQRLELHEGDTEFSSTETVLKKLKGICHSVSQYITAAGANVGFRILGDCNADKTLKNRLMNDI